jgi:hypothetical protein
VKSVSPLFETSGRSEVNFLQKVQQRPTLGGRQTRGTFDFQVGGSRLSVAHRWHEVTPEVCSMTEADLEGTEPKA